ncbi:MAG: MFS transporter [Acidobacteria bacterium]|nr:MFS transporter [Acidobacteriota bacterium]
MTKTERNWILYDVANSAFILIVGTAVGPIFFKDVISRGVDGTLSTQHWGDATSLASLVLAVLAPIIGAMADYRGFKKKMFVVFLFLGILFTVLMPSIGIGNWLWFLAVYVVARVGYAGANVFYDSFLVDVTEKGRMDWVSSSGYAWGYVGSVIPFLIVIFIVFKEMSQTGSDALPAFSGRIAFLIVAVWWAFLSVPMLRRVRQKHFIESGGRPVRDSFIRLGRTFRDIRKYRRVFMFLAAYFFYIDGVDTIIMMCTTYGRDIGLGATTLISAILMIQVVAFPFALVYGKLAGRFSALKLLFVGIVVFVGITVAAFFLSDVADLRLKVWLYFILSFVVATSMGGIQALSRSVFAGLIPTERSAEFFGFYNIFGKFATVLGPAMMGRIGYAAGDTKWGVLSIIILFVIGGVLLLRVEKGPPADAPL